MKFALSTFLLALSVVVAGQDSDPNYGVISPADGTTISQNTPLNLTFAPHRYFKESAKTIDVFLLNGATTISPKAGINAKQVVSGMTPNIEVVYDGIQAQGYQVNIDLTQLSAPVPGDRTVLVKESFNGFGGVDSTNYWSQTFSVTA
ncbi:hypothetical protein E1B28_010650 [Marasmius oreades]|uniref:Uncharacterized protein n=1 Tax=Marasmius oreades TaxID=181124 RepID=A0A9P7RY81_9AGAR|nr:uncharacterized protein E1B28_010650 [Marasmius oreades]KAG7091630.1 hypothetical protein E1B28_010650 [Marasmius oreades]